MINEIDGCMYIIKTKPKHDKKLGDDKKQPHSLGKKEKKKRTLGIMRYGEEKSYLWLVGYRLIDIQIDSSDGEWSRAEQRRLLWSGSSTSPL